MKINFHRNLLIILWIIVILLSVVSIAVGLTLRGYGGGWGPGGWEESYRYWRAGSIIVTFAVPIILIGGTLLLSLVILVFIKPQRQPVLNVGEYNKNEVIDKAPIVTETVSTHKNNSNSYLVQDNTRTIFFILFPVGIVLTIIIEIVMWAVEAPKGLCTVTNSLFGILLLIVVILLAYDVFAINTARVKNGQEKLLSLTGQIVLTVVLILACCLPFFIYYPIWLFVRAKYYRHGMMAAIIGNIIMGLIMIILFVIAIVAITNNSYR